MKSYEAIFITLCVLKLEKQKLLTCSSLQLPVAKESLKRYLLYMPSVFFLPLGCIYVTKKEPVPFPFCN